MKKVISKSTKTIGKNSPIKSRKNKRLATTVELLEFIRILTPNKNPLIKTLSKIYLKHSRAIKIEDLTVQHSLLRSTNNVSIFKNTDVILVLSTIRDGKSSMEKCAIVNNDFPTSVFDVFLAHIQIKLFGDTFLFGTTTTEISRADINNISLLKVVNKTTYIFLDNGIYYKCKKSLKEFENVLKTNPIFLRISDNCIVNLKKFIDVKGQRIYLPYPSELNHTVLKNDFMESIQSVNKKGEKGDLERSNERDNLEPSIKDPKNTEETVEEKALKYLTKMIEIDSKTNKKMFSLIISDELQKDMMDKISKAFA